MSPPRAKTTTAGYSGTPLPDKLRIKAGARVGGSGLRLVVRRELR